MYGWSYVLVVFACIFTFWAQLKVSRAYGRYSRVPNRRGITGAQAAGMIMRANGIDVPVEVIPGKLSDHFDPSANVLRLSSEVANGSTVASVAIAAHEVGHALQHAEDYTPIQIRGAIVPVVNISSKLAWPLIVLGIILSAAGRADGIGDTVLLIGIILFAAVVAFHLVTLPVELNASRRALAQLEDADIVFEDETKGARRVLKAAAMTYLAALAVALAQLIRLLVIRGED